MGPFLDLASRSTRGAPNRLTQPRPSVRHAVILLLTACTSSAAGLGANSLPPGVADLCAGAGIVGRAKVKYSRAAKPAKGQTVTDPDFGTTIRRVTDVQSEWDSKVAIPAYPTIPAWNADESLLVLYVTGGAPGAFGLVLLDGKTYAFKKRLNINPADIEEFYWDMRDPDLIYYVSNYEREHTLIRFHVSSGKADAVHEFSRDIASGALSACRQTDKIGGGADPFFMSYDNDLIGLGCRLPSTGSHGASMFQAFSYRLSTNTIGRSFANESVVPQATPSGKATYFYNDSKKVHVLDPVTNAELRRIAWDGFSHGDMLLSGRGDDVVAGVQYDGPSGSGTLMVANLSRGDVTTIIGKANGDPYPPSGTLISGKAFKQPGWVAVGVNGTNVASLTSTYLAQEILLANVDTGRFCRLAHHRSFGADKEARGGTYWAQPNVVISPSGTRILFPSDWGGGPTIDTYVIELPAYKR